MTVELTYNSFPIAFEIPSQNVIERFAEKLEVIAFLQKEVDFWRVLRASANSWQQMQVVDQLVADLGQAHANQALTAVSSAEGPAEIQNALQRFEARTAVFAASRDGRLILDALEKGYQHPLALAVAAAGDSSSGVQYEHLVGHRPTFVDLVLTSSGASKLSELRSQAQSQKSEINRILAKARDSLKDVQAKQHDIDAWFEAHRSQLDEGVASSVKALKQSEVTFTKAFERALLQTEQMIGDFSRDLTQKHTAKQAELTAEADQTFFDVQERLQKLETLYSSKLVLQGPSKLWRGVRDSSRNWSIGALVLFIILLAGPFYLAAAHWPDLSTFLKDLVATSGNGVSLAALATLTIPAIGYGWLLRHISRVFIHNMALKSDAEYREVLATTFLGLAEQNSTGVTEAERVLVLNALFRPAPPNTPEDGPPLGIMDLLKKS